VFVGQSSKLFRAKSKRLKLIKWTRQGETICLGFRIRPASADFPPAGGVWGGMRAGFGLGVFGNSAATKSENTD
jgi:hypothetical protein